MNRILKLFILSMLSVTASAQTYNFFPPPGYNCSAGPPAQIPYAAAANKLACGPLSWSPSTQILSALGSGFSFSSSNGSPVGNIAYNPSTGSLLMSGPTLTSGVTGGKAGWSNIDAFTIVTRPGAPPGTSDILLQTSADSAGTGGPIQIVGSGGTGNGNGATVTVNAGNAAGTGQAGFNSFTAGNGGTTQNGGSNFFNAGLSGTANNTIGGSNFFTAGGIGGLIGFGGDNAFAPGAGSSSTNCGRNRLQDASAVDIFFTDCVDDNAVMTPSSTSGARTTSFLYLPKCAAAPTGVPADLTGVYANSTPVCFDTADNRLYGYNAAWQPFGVNTGAANPSGLIGLTAVNGSANTYTRSDATHALDQSIAPTWTGLHIFNSGGGSTPSVRIGSTGSQGILCIGNSSTCNSFPTAGDTAHTFEIVNNGGSLQGMRLLTFASGASFITPLHWARANGTQSAPTAILSGDSLLSIGARGYNGSVMTGSTLGIEGFATENWSGTALGSEFEFQIVPTTTTTRIPIFRLQATAAANNPTIVTNGAGNTSEGYVLVVDNTGARFGFFGKSTNTDATVAYESDSTLQLVANNGADKITTDTTHTTTISNSNGTVLGAATGGGQGNGTLNTAGNIFINGAPVLLSGTSGSLGGGALAAGACASTTLTVTGATTSMVATLSPNTYPGDSAYWKARVSAANTVTLYVCEAVAGTPTASTYNVRVH